MAKKVLFIDRDGTLIIEPADEQIDSFEKLQFLPGMFQYLSKIVQELDYELVMVTNQDGLGTDSFPEDTFWPVQNFIIEALENEGITFSEILIDRSFPEDGLETRKPGLGMMQQYIYGAFNLSESFVIGDRASDIQLAKNLKSKGIYIGNDCPDADFQVQSWKEIYELLQQQERIATVVRKTNETAIEVSINLDNASVRNIDTGLSFFDHMLDQLAKHGQIGLEVLVDGDLEVDEHHTIEDTAIVLGEAFKQALGAKKGIERYGFLLPMDDCLAQVAIDFGGRPWLVWDVNFNREMVGDMPTEMFMHFFKSFSDAAACNWNIKAEGDNEHHKIESIFKAWAKAIKMAIRNGGNNELPSTKGSL